MSKRARHMTSVRAPPTKAEETLRKYAAAAAIKLDLVGDWTSFVAGERGRPDVALTAETLPYKASRLLKHLRRRGASVPMRTAPWDLERVLRAASRGSHKSAKDEISFVCEELLEFCHQGFWTVLPLATALQLPYLQLSPLGVVPQRNRRPRLIVDYTYSGVNDDTIRLAPPEAMQFDKAFYRLLSRIVHADPAYGPVWLGKIDIADGFYRIGLQPRDIPKLGVILPTSGDEPLVAPPPVPSHGLGGKSVVLHVGHRNCLRPSQRIPSPAHRVAAAPFGVPSGDSATRRDDDDLQWNDSPRPIPRAATCTSSCV